EVHKNPGSRRGANSASIERVFMRDGDAVQWLVIDTGGQIAIHLRGALQRLIFSHDQERVENRLGALNSIQSFARQFDGRNFPFPKCPPGFEDRHSMSLGVHSGLENGIVSRKGRKDCSNFSSGPITVTLSSSCRSIFNIEASPCQSVISAN